MEQFSTIGNGFQPLTIAVKYSILVVCVTPGHLSDIPVEYGDLRAVSAKSPNAAQSRIHNLAKDIR